MKKLFLLLFLISGCGSSAPNLPVTQLYFNYWNKTTYPIPQTGYHMFYFYKNTYCLNAQYLFNGWYLYNCQGGVYFYGVPYFYYVYKR